MTDAIDRRPEVTTAGDRPTASDPWERLLASRRDGGVCSSCGRALDADEPVWQRRLILVRAWGEYVGEVSRRAFVGRECAGLEVLRDAEGRPPVPCATCGRRMHVTASSRRTTVACSRRCRSRVSGRREARGPSS